MTEETTGEWILTAAVESVGLCEVTIRSRMRAGNIWHRRDPATGDWAVWVDAMQSRKASRATRWINIGPAPEGAAPIPTRDPATGHQRAPVYEPPAQLANIPRVAASASGAAIDYDAEKDRIRVKIAGRVGVNMDGRRVDAILQQIDGDGIAARLERLAQTYSVPTRQADPAVEAVDDFQLHLALRDLHAGDGDASQRTRQLTELLHQSCDRAARLVGGLGSIALPCGSDLLTIDTYGRTTTKGTQLFPDATPEQVADIALEWMVIAVDVARQYAPRVVVVREPGNHDRLTSYHIALALRAWFRSTEGVDVRCEHEARSYLRHGRQLVCYDHSDQVRDLGKYPAIVAAEQREAWGQTDHAWVFVGHRHHLDVRSKDLSGVTVMQSRSLSPSSEYERGLGFVGGRRSLESWLLGARSGMVAHLSAL
jgi:hypothetical protein